MDTNDEARRILNEQCNDACWHFDQLMKIGKGECDADRIFQVLELIRVVYESPNDFIYLSVLDHYNNNYKT
jgi:hypothetical protein